MYFFLTHRPICKSFSTFENVPPPQAFAVYAYMGAPQFADFEVAADEIAAKIWPPCKRPTI